MGLEGTGGPGGVAAGGVDEGGEREQGFITRCPPPPQRPRAFGVSGEMEGGSGVVGAVTVAWLVAAVVVVAVAVTTAAVASGSGTGSGRGEQWRWVGRWQGRWWWGG